MKYSIAFYYKKCTEPPAKKNKNKHMHTKKKKKKKKAENSQYEGL